jgi:Mrp family chromosome partitioning ATPase
VAPFAEQGSGQDAVDTADLPTLSVIRPVEDGDPAAYLSSPRFARFVQDARKSFAHILVVAESVLESPSALVAMSLSDGVVLLVKEHETTTTTLTEAKQILVRNGAKLLGFLYEKH